MTSLCIYFQVHQPHRLRKYSFFDIGSGRSYFNDVRNKEIFEKVAKKCYFPTNALLLELLEKHPEFSFSFSITGTFIEQCLSFDPEVLESFKKLVDTGRVDLLDETYYHSLAYLISPEEFREQVEHHRRAMKELFDYKPRVFRNTEAMYNNEIAMTVESMGYDAIVAEGWDRHLGWRSPNYVYRPHGCSSIKLLLRNYKLSDDIAFRFSTREWKEYPLTADKYARWLSGNEGQVVNLFMDFETFGEHQWKETGIFEFLKQLPIELKAHDHIDFKNTVQVADTYEPVGEMNMHDFTSWADVDRDLSAWLGNDMQHAAFEALKELGTDIITSGDEQLIDDWRKLQTSDHFYYMCTKWFADGDIHKYFNDYENPYDAFTNYMNILADFRQRI
jgi:alpha-amylase